MDSTLETLQTDIIQEAKKGYPIFAIRFDCVFVISLLTVHFSNESCPFNLDFWIECYISIWTVVRENFKCKFDNEK